MNHKMPKNYKVPPGYVLVEVFEQEAIDPLTGMHLPAYDQDKYNMWVKVEKIGGNIFRQLKTFFIFGFRKGDTVRVKRTVDGVFTEGGKKFIVVFEEDINLIR